MASQPKKRDLADFFKPYARSNVPAKRPSPTLQDEDASNQAAASRHPKQRDRDPPQTPTSASRFHDVVDLVSSPNQPPFGGGPRSGASVSLSMPIRSPRPEALADRDPPPTSTRGTPRGRETSSSLFHSKLQTARAQETGKGAMTTTGFEFADMSSSGSGAGSPEKFQTSVSFEDIPSSGQRVLKDGKVVAVRSSDDEDSDSLASLDDLLGRRAPVDPPTSSSSPPDAADLESTRAHTLSLFTNGRSIPLIGRDKLRDLHSRANNHKFDISLLIGDHFDDQEVETNIARARDGYEKVKLEEERSKLRGGIDKNLLASIVTGTGHGGDGDGDVSRLLNAVERTEALNAEKTWSFWGSCGFSDPSQNPVRFPPNESQSGSWTERLQNPASRERAFLSGYVAEAWQKGDPPSSLVAWTFDSVIGEARDDLRRSYIQALRGVGHKWPRYHVTTTTIENLFLRLGVAPQSMDCEAPIEPAVHRPTEYNSTQHSYLLSALEMLVAIAAGLGLEEIHKVVCIVARMTLDADLMNDGRVSIAVEDALSYLLTIPVPTNCAPVSEVLLRDVGQKIKDSSLQAQLLKHLLPASPEAAALRVALARQFLLDKDKDIDGKLLLPAAGPMIDLRELALHLESPLYDPTLHGRIYDYPSLTSRTHLLDIAVSHGGWSPPSSSSSLHPHSAAAVLAAQASALTAFNASVDQLADRIKSIFSSIADTGASHMRRTEAKEALQWLHLRLLYGVRTEPRPKKNVFGTDGRNGRGGLSSTELERGRGIMQRWMERKNSKREREREAAGGEVQMDGAAEDGNEDGDPSKRSEEGGANQGYHRDHPRGAGGGGATIATTTTATTTITKASKEEEALPPPPPPELEQQSNPSSSSSSSAAPPGHQAPQQQQEDEDEETLIRRQLGLVGGDG